MVVAGGDNLALHQQFASAGTTPGLLKHCLKPLEKSGGFVLR